MLYVLSCTACLLPYVFLYLTCLVPYPPRALYALVPHVSCVLLVLVPTCLVCHVSRAIDGLVLHVSCVLRAPVFQLPRTTRASCSMWSRASRFMSPSSLCTLLFHTLRTLCPNITFCALEFPCIMLLCFCSFATCDFFWESY